MGDRMAYTLPSFDAGGRTSSKGRLEDGAMKFAAEGDRSHSHGTRQILFCTLFAVVLLLLFAPAAHAYVGPGAGFAVLSLFLTLFMASVQAVIAFLTWPIRQCFRFLRRRRAYRKAKTKRVVILG